MKRCPLCTCGAEFINKTEYYAKQTGAFSITAGAGIVTGLFHPSSSTHAAHTTYENLKEKIAKKYKSTNPRCGHNWEEY